MSVTFPGKKHKQGTITIIMCFSSPSSDWSATEDMLSYRNKLQLTCMRNIDDAQTTLFGSLSGVKKQTPAITVFYHRCEKKTEIPGFLL